MISKIFFTKPLNIDRKLANFQDIYTVQSVVKKSVVYGFSDGKFAILQREGAIFCPIHEVPQLANLLKPRIKEEVMEVFEDFKSLGLERVWK